MKNLILIVIAIFACLSLQAQIQPPEDIGSNLSIYGNYCFDQIAESTGGYLLLDPDLDEGDWSITGVIQLPGYYSFDLLRMDVSNFLNRHSDLFMVQSWRPHGTGHTYIMRFAEEYILIFYYEDSLVLMSLSYSP